MLVEQDVIRRRTNTRARIKAHSRRKSSSAAPVLPRVLGDLSYGVIRFPKSKIRVFADSNRSTPTRAEQRFERILNGRKGGVLKGRFTRQISGKWIVDFYFPEVRLAVEIDGSSHSTEKQKVRDRIKERDCCRFDITLVRFRNADVFGRRDALVKRLRSGWRQALKRKMKIIGRPPMRIR